MAKVIKQFYCTQEKVNYNVNDEYKGKRTDLKAYLEPTKRVVKKNKK